MKNKQPLIIEKCQQHENVMTISDLVSSLIQDQSGKLCARKGKHMTKAELATTNWYVQGIKGSIPK